MWRAVGRDDEWVLAAARGAEGSRSVGVDTLISGRTERGVATHSGHSAREGERGGFFVGFYRVICCNDLKLGWMDGLRA